MSHFETPKGLAEHFLALTATCGFSFAEECREVLQMYRNYAAGMTPVLLRFHLSDIANQIDTLRKLTADEAIPVAVVGQPPANGRRIALEAWLLEGAVHGQKSRDGAWDLALQHYRLAWLVRPGCTESGSAEQTHAEFRFAEKLLAQRGGTVADHLLRTWLYCRDIDNQYAGLVRARRELFLEYGLNEHTHYIASTGIEGLPDPCARLVRMDSLALFCHDPAQIEYMSAPEYLSPTQLYGVTFERGTRIIYGDRSHYFISGTASIDGEGHTVHLHDIARQTERMLQNVQALLARHGGRMADIRYVTLYLRDPADREIVEAIVNAMLPDDCAKLTVRGAVCRPGWLVEMEAIAVNNNGNRRFADFI